MIQFSAKTARMAFAALLLFGNADWVTDSAASPASLAAFVKKADDAYQISRVRLRLTILPCENFA